MSADPLIWYTHYLNCCGIMKTMRMDAISITLVFCLFVLVVVGMPIVGDCHGDCTGCDRNCSEDCSESCFHVCSHAVILGNSIPDCTQGSTTHSINDEQVVAHTPVSGVFQPPEAIV